MRIVLLADEEHSSVTGLGGSAAESFMGELTDSSATSTPGGPAHSINA